MRWGRSAGTWAARKPDPHQAFKRLSEMSYGNQVRTVPHDRIGSGSGSV
jgi:hypothetical protein